MLALDSQVISASTLPGFSNKKRYELTQEGGVASAQEIAKVWLFLIGTHAHPPDYLNTTNTGVRCT